MLDKPEFDCNNLGSFYDCGCADGEESETGSDNKDPHSTTARTDAQTGSSEHDHLVVEISKEAWVPLWVPSNDLLVFAADKWG